MPSFAQTRRGLVLGLIGLTCGGAAPRGLPSQLFSLTEWGEGQEIDFLLLNVTEQRLKFLSPFDRKLGVRCDIRLVDAAGEVLTRSANGDGYVATWELDPAVWTDEAVRKGARNLGRWKAQKGKMSTRALHAAIAPALSRPLTAGEIVELGFRMRVPVVAPSGQVVIATVTSRSVCRWRLDGDKVFSLCRDPYFIGDLKP